MATAEYHTPQQDDLLWVYEGLTEYYGDVLAARAAFRTPQETLDAFDRAAYDVDQPGRRWRTVQDTADASPILRGNDAAYSSWRLTQDYYHEGALLWLEADVTIRRLSGGKRSLDDFAATFVAATASGSNGDTGPGVLTYRFEDVVRALNETQPYGWADFWTSRLNALTAKPPLAGLEAAGYSYTDGETMVPDEAAFMAASHMAEMFHALGIFAGPDGTLRDVWIGSPAFVAGLGPGDKLTAVNGQPYTADLLTKVVHDSKTSTGPIILTASRDDESATYTIDYHGGEKYAVLKRNGNPDVLTTEILAPRR
jgi:predicted metalloprotease with PDZ domain